MRLTSKVRIYPSDKAEEVLWDVSQLCTSLWNIALNERIQNPKVTVYDQKKRIPLIKKEDTAFKRPSSQVLQNVIFSLDQSWKMFSTKQKQGDRKVRPPKHKSSKFFFTQEYSQVNTSFKITDEADGTVLRLAYGSRPSQWIRIPIESGNYQEAKTATIVYQNKKWYVCFSYKISLPPLREEGEVVYFDPGCRMALTGVTSQGQFFEYDIRPLYDINKETHVLIDDLKAKRATKRKGSYHYHRFNQQIRDLYTKVKKRTEVYLHTLALRIVNTHQEARLFAIGNWSKKDTLADTGNKYVNKKINRAVQNNHPLEKLIGCLTYKALLRGQDVQRFDERGTTRTCVACNYVHKNGINPSVKVFKCQKCAFTLPRDHHSCLNFLKKYESVSWQRLVGDLPTRSTRIDLHPFLFKSRYSVHTIAAS